MKRGIVIEATGAECWRDHHAQLVPGGHLAVLTTIARYHRAAAAIEDAGFEVRDQLKWMTRVGTYPICLARKPFKGTVAENVLQHGAGALNIDATRIATTDRWEKRQTPVYHDTAAGFGKGLLMGSGKHALGRWPANLITDGSPEIVALFPATKSPATTTSHQPPAPNYKNKVYGRGMGGCWHPGFDDEGSAARFFATAPDKPALFAYLRRLIGATTA